MCSRGIPDFFAAIRSLFAVGVENDEIEKKTWMRGNVKLFWHELDVELFLQTERKLIYFTK